MNATDIESVVLKQCPSYIAINIYSRNLLDLLYASKDMRNLTWLVNDTPSCLTYYNKLHYTPDQFLGRLQPNRRSIMKDGIQFMVYYDASNPYNLLSPKVRSVILSFRALDPRLEIPPAVLVTFSTNPVKQGGNP